MRTMTLLLGLLGTLWLSGCGQKGDLYLAPDAPPPATEKADKKETPAKTG